LTPPSGGGSSSLVPLLESLEDGAAGLSEHTDAYLTIANRLSGEEGRQFLPAVEKHFSRLGKSILAHITSSNAELSQAALQALGFCVYHSHVVSGVPEAFGAEILSALCSLVAKSTDKNTCTRALWVVSKQSFPPDVVGKKVSSILGTLESVWSRDDVQSVVMEHEAVNVIIRMLEQVPVQMGDGAVRWAKLIVPLVVHSASKVRLRAAAAMEMGMPLLLEKQTEVAAIIEPMMSSKLIPELQKLFMSKNEANVLKLWPLFVKLLGKLLHRGGPFINSLLHLEELGFRSSSPTVKKIAFIAWKSLIDNFALNPDILSSAKRMKLLMQPLASIHVRTEALLLTKVEVWWYLVVQLGPNLAPNFDLVSVPLLQCTIGCDSPPVSGTPSRAVAQNGAAAPGTPKTGNASFNTSTNMPRMSLNSSVQVSSTFASIQLLGLEMLLHYILGPEAVAAAAKRKLALSLEPLNHPLLSGASSFTKHAAVLIANIRDGFINVGKDAPGKLSPTPPAVMCITVHPSSQIWKLRATDLSVFRKNEDRQGCEVLTLMLQALQSIVASEALPADRVLVLLEATVKGVPQRVLGSASYQVGKMDVLNGTPALFLILLLFDSSLLAAYIEDERFFLCLQMLVGCGLSGHTSPLAFAEAVLAAIGGSAASLQSKEQLWRMWSAMVGPLTDTVTQSNEVNQGDALEHNFSAMGQPDRDLRISLTQASQKSMLSTWSKLYKVFARCSALVVTAEENICCEELCAKMAASLDRDALTVPSTLNAVAVVLQVMVECVDFSPYSPNFQQRLKSPHTPVNWTRKRNKALGNLSAFQSLLVRCLEVYLEASEASSPEASGVALVSVLSALISNLVLANAVQEALASLLPHLTLFYKHAATEPPKFTSQLLAKLEKLLADVLGCVQSRSAVAFNDELLALLSPLLCVLFPHKNKQLRTSVSQFWNATFANSVSLAYPEEIRPILSQVKQKIPIILPGFEVVAVSDELSGQYSVSFLTKETQDYASPKEADMETRQQVEMIPESTDVSMEEDAKSDDKAEDMDVQVNEGSSPNVSGSSDLVSGTPQKPNSRRQSFITLEKYAEGKPASPSSASTFTGPLNKSSNSQEHSNKTPSSQSSQTSVGPNSQDSQSTRTGKVDSLHPVNNAMDSPRRPKDSGIKSEPVRLTERLPSDTTEDEDVIPDTQTEAEGKEKEKLEEIEPSSQEEELDDSQSQTSPTEPRRSGRQKDRPALPAEDPEERGDKYLLVKRKRSSEEAKSVSPKSIATESRVTRRSKQIAEEDASREKLRTRAQKAQIETSQTNSQGRGHKKTKLFSSSDDFLDKPESRRSGSTREQESSQNNLQSNCESQSQGGRRGRRSKASLEINEESGVKKTKKDLHEKEQSSQTAAHEVELVEQTDKDDSQMITPSPQSGDRSKEFEHVEPTKKDNHESQELELVEQTKKDGETPKDSQIPTSSQADGQSEEFELVEKAKKEQSDSLIGGSSPTNESQDEADTTNQLVNESQDNLSQGDSNLITPSSSDSQSRRRSRRSKASSEAAAESEDKNDSKAVGRLSRSTSKTTVSAVGQAEAGIGGRTRRSKVQELSKPSPISTPESSQSLDVPGSTESSQGRGRYSRRRSSQVLVGSLESSESESSEGRENPPMPKKRGRKPRASLPSPLALESKVDGIKNDSANDIAGNSQEADTQSIEVKTDLEKSQESQDLQDSESLQVTADTAEERSQASPMKVEVDAVVTSGSEFDVTKRSSESPRKTENTAQESDTDDFEILEPVGISDEQIQEATPIDPSPVDELAPEETREQPQVSESSEDKAEEVSETGDGDKENLNADSDQEHPVVPVEETTLDGNQVECPNVKDELLKEDEPSASSDHTNAGTEEAITPAQENDKDEQTLTSNTQTTECQDEEQTLTSNTENDVVANLDAALQDLCDAAVSADSTGKYVGFLDSPAKQKDLEALMNLEVGQSPSSGRTRGTWSPSASPSTSILKKGQKRPLEDETPSPLVKSRRVSFANPIQRQETADDIDRRSPAVRTSSPRRSKVTGIPQPKYVTTPTKGLLILSPRNMRSPGSKSSKKSLISEMSQEPGPVSRDCIYPALVGCSAPVEAVLPQISSNMWSRGFGQLVRARNIKTVGDLSALTPGEIKTLPIRSPKISNVKKALKIYEQQVRRGSDTRM
uniref:Replication timing regulatory factor 1 n=1 Tax=Scophthalmus maximus TaxID=52904 RepID=A0A8D3AKT3_SCOMX